jgi:hypothetical protein
MRNRQVDKTENQNAEYEYPVEYTERHCPSPALQAAAAPVTPHAPLLLHRWQKDVYTK